MGSNWKRTLGPQDDERDSAGCLDEPAHKWRSLERTAHATVAAKAMRQILVDHAKAQQRQKRGAGASKIDLDEAALISPEQTGAILDLNDALERLAMLDSRTAHVVELRFFGGLNQDEVAEVLKISPVTVRRDWVFARAWLYKELHTPA